MTQIIGNKIRPDVKECDNASFMPMPESKYVSEGLDRFPLLVWKRILEYCMSWDYLEMLTFFEVVNLPKDFLSDPTINTVKQNVTFHEILPTIFANYKEWEDGTLLEIQDISNCRLVCRAWNSAIRKNVESNVSRSHPNCCLQEWDNNFLWPKETRNVYAIFCNNAYSRLRHTYEIKSFLNKFRKSHYKSDVSPFHCHHVGFRFTNRKEPTHSELTVELAGEIFHQYGKHLRRVNLNLCCSTWNDMNSFYYSVINLIRLSPNLEALRIMWRTTFKDGRFWKRRANYFRCYPELKSLTHLEVDCLPYKPFNDMIRSNGARIEKLKISSLEGNSSAVLRKYALHRVPLMNLRELRISFEFATEMDIARLAESAPLWTKLEKLYLDFERDASKDSSCIPWAWTLILRCLNKLSSKTVTHLWLKFPKVSSNLNKFPLHDYRPTREEQLNLSNLEHVVLKFPPGSVFSLDFLSELDKIKTLFIHELDYPPTQFDERDKPKFAMLRKYQNRLGPDKINDPPSYNFQYSNIWEELPKLSNLYWRQGEHRWAWKKITCRKGNYKRAQLTTWTLRDRVEEMFEHWTHFWQPNWTIF